MIVFLGTYWSVSFMYAFMDFTQRPKFLMKYKIQPGRNEPLDMKKFIKVVAKVMLNDSLLLPAMLLEYPRWSVANPNIRNVPSTMETFKALFVCMLVHDFLFYHFHR